LKTLKAKAHRLGRPMAVHVAESAEELEFITTGRGAWAQLLHHRGIDFSDWGLPAGSPLGHLDSLGLLDGTTLAVHLVHADSRDLSLLEKRGTPMCVCPRSNQALHGCLPDVAGLLAAGPPVALGTDSLASVSSLNLFDEMAFLASAAPQLEPARILAMATIGGAAALGLDREWGALAPGRRARFLYIPLEAGSKRELVSRLVHHECSHPPRWIG
jgi:cytosine/adenosine deaminase-related metal-dependent hydrolase